MPQPKDHVPYSNAVLYLKNGASRMLTCLFDSGSGITWGHQNILPKGCNPKTVERLEGNTLAGNFSSNQQITADSLLLPEFFKQRALSDVPIRMMNQPCKYDIILGRDALSRLGMLLDFDTHQMTWDGSRGVHVWG